MPTTCKLIAKTTLGSSASNIEFTSIPGTYTDLLLFLSARTDRSGVNRDDVKVEFNGSSSNLSSRILVGNGSTATSSSDTVIYGPPAVGATGTSDTFGNGYIYIPNYAGSTNKSVSVEGASESNTTTTLLYAVAGLWSSTAAITSIKLLPYTGPNFVANTSAYLYGILKA
jgi:hypothetical protein